METIFTFIGGVAFGAFLMFHNRKPRDKYILNQIRELIIDNKIQTRKIMATLAELNAKIDELEATVNAEQEQITAAISGLQATIDELRAQLEDQDPAAIQAAIDRLDAIKADLESTVADEEEPEEPEEPTV